jgi:predicted ATPase
VLGGPLLRIKGALILDEGARGAATVAEDHFLQGLDLARLQGARSWELRCATSLARLWRDQTRSKEARQLLAPVYDRFTEGFATADLRAAKALLDLFWELRCATITRRRLSDWPAVVRYAAASRCWASAYLSHRV